MNKREEIVVMKFGGTSVQSPKHIRRVAEHIVRQSRSGIQPVVVVSAMGQTTNQILNLFRETCPTAPSREIDLALATGEQLSAALVASAICSLGADAKSLIAQQMRLTASGPHQRGRILAIQGAAMMREEILAGKILVCAGFQGITDKGEVITLGRGGSDTTAVALAHALKASCEIYTDVEGVYAVDPRIVPNARHFSFIRYSDMLTMSSAGAGVLMDRAVLLAQRLSIPLRVKLSPSLGETGEGTLVYFRDEKEETIEEVEDLSIVGLAIRQNIAVITISDISNRPGTAAGIFKQLSDVVIGDAIQGRGGKKANISCWIDSGDVSKVMRTIPNCRLRRNVACLTLVSPGMKEDKGYLARMTGALAKATVNIEMIGTAGESILVIVHANQVKKAARAIAVEFQLCE